MHFTVIKCFYLIWLVSCRVIFGCFFYRMGGFFSRITKWIHSEQSPCSGHFENLRPDGTVIPVNSEGKNCLYHAVAQATCKNPGDVRNEAKILRNEVKNTVSLYCWVKVFTTIHFILVIINNSYPLLPLPNTYDFYESPKNKLIKNRHWSWSRKQIW